MYNVNEVRKAVKVAGTGLRNQVRMVDEAVEESKKIGDAIYEMEQQTLAALEKAKKLRKVFSIEKMDELLATLENIVYTAEYGNGVHEETTRMLNKASTALSVGAVVINEVNEAVLEQFTSQPEADKCNWLEWEKCESSLEAFSCGASCSHGKVVSVPSCM